MNDSVVLVELRNIIVAGEGLTKPGVDMLRLVRAALGSRLYTLEDVQHLFCVI